MTQTGAGAIARDVRGGRLDPVRLAAAHLAAIAAANPTLHALIHVAEAAASRDAVRVRDLAASGRDPGRLAGVPVIVKDVFDVAGMPTTANCRLFAQARPAGGDSTVAARLRAAGAVILGKANCWEMSVGGPSRESPWAPAVNPCAPGADPGGSSSGSAVAVAAGLAVAAIGGDTGGSVRLPAAFCGVAGFKPSHGLVPMQGALPFARSLDVAGPIAHSAADCALLHAVLSDTSQAAIPPLAGLRLGVPDTLIAHGAPTPGASAAFAAALAALIAAGVSVRMVNLPSAALFNDCYFLIARSEAYACWRTTLAAHAGSLNTLTRRSLALGALLPPDAVLDARRRRRLLTAELDAAFDGIDALVLPTTPDEAGDLDIADSFSHPDTAPYTRPFSLACVPAISLPCGTGPRGRPLGLQLVGRRHDDARLLAFACAVEPVLLAGDRVRKTAWWN